MSRQLLRYSKKFAVQQSRQFTPLIITGIAVVLGSTVVHYAYKAFTSPRSPVQNQEETEDDAPQSSSTNKTSKEPPTVNSQGRSRPKKATPTKASFENIWTIDYGSSLAKLSYNGSIIENHEGKRSVPIVFHSTPEGFSLSKSGMWMKPNDFVYGLLPFTGLDSMDPIYSSLSKSNYLQSHPFVKENSDDGDFEVIMSNRGGESEEKENSFEIEHFHKHVFSHLKMIASSKGVKFSSPSTGLIMNIPNYFSSYQKTMFQSTLTNIGLTCKHMIPDSICAYYGAVEQEVIPPHIQSALTTTTTSTTTHASSSSDSSTSILPQPQSYLLVVDLGGKYTQLSLLRSTNENEKKKNNKNNSKNNNKKVSESIDDDSESDDDDEEKEEKDKHNKTDSSSFSINENDIVSSHSTDFQPQSYGSLTLSSQSTLFSLGSDSIDSFIASHLAIKFSKENNDQNLLSDSMAYQRLMEASEAARFDLSGSVETQINIPFITADERGPKHLSHRFSRSQLDQILEKDFSTPLVEGILSFLESELSKQQVQREEKEGGRRRELVGVLLVGGGSRVMTLRKAVDQAMKTYSHSKGSTITPEVFVGKQPEEMICLGARAYWQSTQ